MTEDAFESVAERYERIAGELESAAGHARVAANHYREHEVPRGCAHAFAGQGHLRTAQSLLDELAVLHASRSTTDV